MRKLFSRQLIEARHEMLSIYEAVDLALHDAVKAYVTDDRKLATKTKKRTLSIDARCANLEAVCYNLIATQSPVASDFRLLQTIIYVDFNLQHMTDKVRQICRATRHMVKADISLPQELVGTVEAEAEAVYQVLGSSLSALVTNDMSIICNLAVEDEPVHVGLVIALFDVCLVHHQIVVAGRVAPVGVVIGAVGVGECEVIGIGLFAVSAVFIVVVAACGEGRQGQRGGQEQ